MVGKYNSHSDAFSYVRTLFFILTINLILELQKEGGLYQSDEKALFEPGTLG